jgi:hypothetical protein
MQKHPDSIHRFDLGGRRFFPYIISCLLFFYFVLEYTFVFIVYFILFLVVMDLKLLLL